MLPFLENKKWPRIAKPVGEKSYGFSEDDELKEQCAHEMMQALEEKDHSKFIESLKAYVEMILAKEDDAEPHQ